MVDSDTKAHMGGSRTGKAIHLEVARILAPLLLVTIGREGRERQDVALLDQGVSDDFVPVCTADEKLQGSVEPQRLLDGRAQQGTVAGNPLVESGTFQ